MGRALRAPRVVNREDYLMYSYALPNPDAERSRHRYDHPLDRGQEQPLVAPQVSHLRQVPLRTSVKLPHSKHASPS